jgi:23S rRNA (adenine2030-N6)-methyltransferase
MNYRHAFHAGNFADVLKHSVLALCIDRLNAKEKPWRYIDTHAGVGLYDLSSEAAQRSPEWRDGVERVWSAIASAPEPVRAALEPYLTVIRRLNAHGELKLYPGSPLIVRALARDDDALRLCELHPEDVETLRANMSRDRRVKIEQRDGFEALPAFLPPPERRGLVLVDPPFERGSADRKDDFADMLRAARRAAERWRDGVFVFWRPLKDLDAVDAFDGDLATAMIEEAGLPAERLLVADLWVRELGAPGPLAGAGVVIVNPPFGLEQRLGDLLPWLAQLLDQSGDEEAAGYRLVSPEEDFEDEGED